MKKHHGITNRTLIKLITIVFTCMSAHAITAYASISGAPTVIDGDTIKLAQQKIRLHGIDAPETQQDCDTAKLTIPCGHLSSKFLRQLINGQKIICKPKGTDFFNRIIAVCTVNKIDIGKQMVKNGWAFAYLKYSKDYKLDEVHAKQNKKGLWNTKFIYPWKWRQNLRIKK